MLSKSITAAPLLAAAFALTATVPADQIAFDQAPAAVREGFQQHQPTAHPQTATVETEDGATTYTIADPQAGDQHSDVLSADGQILACTHSVPLADVPAAVTAAARQAYPQATFADAQVTMKPNDMSGTTYHLTYSANGMNACATFSENGHELPDPHMAAMSQPASQPARMH